MSSGRVFRNRGAIAHLPLVVILFCRQRETASLAVNWGIGLFLLFAGMALRIWSQSYIHHRLKMPLKLTTNGPYQLVRNPLYIGNILICTSAMFFAGFPLLAPFIFAWCFAVYSLAVSYEEGWLVKLYGAPAENYLQKVPRWFPRFEGNRITFWNEFSLKAVRAELHCLLIGLIFGLKGFRN
jgi:protein-S-isoprenylcysteine O-methyltransferase Ste14